MSKYNETEEIRDDNEGSTGSEEYTSSTTTEEYVDSTTSEEEESTKETPKDDRFERGAGSVGRRGIWV